MAKQLQRVMHCPCGNSKVLALGLCATCYTLKRQDEEYFGGLREAVLSRDEHRCRVCASPGGRKRSIAVHHRAPGRSVLELMITLCLRCHAKVTRTQYLCREWPLLLRVLWREQHPAAHEQTGLDFSVAEPVAKHVRLFPGDGSTNRELRKRRG